jgi:hypothetical protein
MAHAFVAQNHMNDTIASLMLSKKTEYMSHLSLSYCIIPTFAI